MKTMKTLKRSIIGAVALFLASAVHTFGIEGLKLTIHCPDVVLSWPSMEGETYMVQYRETLDTNSTWIWLTNALPAEVGTNLTVFVHSNRVDCPTGQIFGMMFSGGGDGSGESESEGQQENEKPTVPMVASKDESRPPVPLGIYPPGIDLTGYTIIWPDGSTDEWSKELVEKWRASQQVEGGGPEPEDAGGEPGCGFYRVVRTGLHLFGVTNGTVLSGEVTLPVEIGFDDGIEFDGFFVMVGDTNQTVPANGLEFQEVTNGLPRFVLWDTRQVTNGIYQIFLGAQWGETQIYESPPVTVIVSNVIWFPDSWNVAGYYINVEAQSIYTNGSYEVEIFDDTGFQILQVSGTNDSEGFITYPGSRGFGVENFDQNGEIYPSVSYAVVVTAAAAGGGSSATSTNVIWTEFKWPAQGVGWTKFAIGYQPLFGNPAGGGLNAVALQSMIQVVYASAQARPGGLGVIRGSDQNPYELWGQFDFTQLLTPDLRNDLVRNLYYFGHGATTHIGQRGVPRFLSIDDFNFVLRNNFKDPLAGTNAHPFRFVWLDGCYTAKGNLCKAFGIPKEENVATNRFTSRGLRFRAFMGWTGGHLIRVGAFSSQHATFVGDLWDGWPSSGTNGLPRTLREAHTYAATQRGTSSPWQDAVKHLRIYGYEGLRWQDTLP